MVMWVRKKGKRIVTESGINMYTLLYLKWIKKQGPIVYYKELCSILCNNQMGKDFVKKNGYTYTYN